MPPSSRRSLGNDTSTVFRCLIRSGGKRYRISPADNFPPAGVDQFGRQIRCKMQFGIEKTRRRWNSKFGYNFYGANPKNAAY